MSHFINQLMPPTVFNILLGAFLFVKSYIYCFIYVLQVQDRLIMHFDNRITCKNIWNQRHLNPFMNKRKSLKQWFLYVMFHMLDLFSMLCFLWLRPCKRDKIKVNIINKIFKYWIFICQFEFSGRCRSLRSWFRSLFLSWVRRRLPSFLLPPSSLPPSSLLLPPSFLPPSLLALFVTS